MILWAWTLVGLVAAQEPAAEPEAPRPASVPVRAVGFVGRPGGACPVTAVDEPLPCLDVVDFVDPARDGRPLGDDAPAELRAERAASRTSLRDAGALYVRSFEDLVMHWRQADVVGTLQDDGYDKMPPVLQTWGRLVREGTSVAAGPASAILLTDRRWRPTGLAPDAPRVSTEFGRVRFRLSENAHTAVAPDTVRMAGRFAVRLGAAGEAHDYDIMDADTIASAPFYEQMFPYRASSRLSGRVYAARERVPLRAFRSGRPEPLTCEAVGEADRAAAGCDASAFDPVQAVAAGSRTAPDEESARALAHAYFEQFHRVVFVQTAQYAMDEYTTNHMRVLAALSAMANPLLGDADARGLARDLVAAARGETDRASERLASGEGGRRGAEGRGERIVRLGVLPRSAVRPWLDRLLQDTPPTRELLEATRNAVVGRWPVSAEGPARAPALQGLTDEAIAAWTEGITRLTVSQHQASLDVLHEALRQVLDARDDRRLVKLSALPPEVMAPWVTRLLGLSPEPWFREAFQAAVVDALAGSLRTADTDPLPADPTDPDAMAAWFDAWLLPGEDRAAAEETILRAGLWLLLEPLPTAERAQEESWLLGAHVRYAIARTFDESAVATPAEVVDEATTQWSETLGRHGYAPQPFAQGSGAVDPVSVCTTKDGLEALDEPVFKKIVVDQLVAAPRGLGGLAVVEAAGDSMPFRYVDDPTIRPVVTPLAYLGDGQALYRVRWSIWTGWHLLWTTQDASGGRREVVARTGALCEDTVLAPSGLVPTLVRAGLLHANLRPTLPQKRPDPEPRNPDDAPSGDDVADAVSDAPGQAQAALDKAKEARQLLIEPPKAEDLATQEGSFEAAEFEVQLEDLDPSTRYLRKLPWDALLEAHGRQGFLLYVFDASAPTGRRFISRVTPRTPYRQLQRRIPGRYVDGRRGEVLEDGETVRTSAWMWYAHPDDERPVQLAPGYTPRNGVLAGDARPRWTQRRTVDFGLGIDVGAVPFTFVRYDCNTSVVTGPNFGGACTGDESLTAQGFGFGLQGMATLWVNDHPKVAVDLGVGADLLVRPAGQPLFSLGGDDARILTYGWGLRFQAGVLAGLRFAPVPPNLSGARLRAPVWSTTRNGGGVRIGRVEWGLRAGAMIGPGFNGVEATVVGELWSGFSTGPNRGKRAALRPYKPGVLVGPYARVLYGLPAAGGDPERALNLQDSWTMTVGIRTQLRLQKAASVPKEVP